MKSSMIIFKINTDKDQAITNTNVCRRLLHLKQQVEEFQSENSKSLGISSIKYQKFAAKSVEDIPI